VSYTLTLSLEWWMVPATITVILLGYGVWPRKGGLLEGIFELYITIFLVAVTWAVAGFLK
jgi:hypothetical protein